MVACQFTLVTKGNKIGGVRSTEDVIVNGYKSNAGGTYIQGEHKLLFNYKFQTASHLKIESVKDGAKELEVNECVLVIVGGMKYYQLECYDSK